MSDTPRVAELRVIPVAGRDSMLMNLSGAHGPFFTRNVVILLLAMGYSVFALYASGKDAVMGGMLVLGIVYIVWGFIANRFTGQLEGSPAIAAKV